MPKTRINISLDQDLADFAKIFAMENRTTVAGIVTQYIFALKRRTENKNTEHIFADPAFQEAMEQAQDKLKSGDVKWHSYAEVFPD